MADRPIRRHYAFAVAPAKGGWEISHVIEFPALGQAEKHSLTLLARHGDSAAATVEDRELVAGEILPGALIGRADPSR